MNNHTHYTRSKTHMMESEDSDTVNHIPKSPVSNEIGDGMHPDLESEPRSPGRTDNHGLRHFDTDDDHSLPPNSVVMNGQAASSHAATAYIHDLIEGGAGGGPASEHSPILDVGTNGINRTRGGTTTTLVNEAAESQSSHIEQVRRGNSGIRPPPNHVHVGHPHHTKA